MRMNIEDRSQESVEHLQWSELFSRHMCLTMSHEINKVRDINKVFKQYQGKLLLGRESVMS